MADRSELPTVNEKRVLLDNALGRGLLAVLAHGRATNTISAAMAKTLINAALEVRATVPPTPASHSAGHTYTPARSQFPLCHCSPCAPGPPAQHHSRRSKVSYSMSTPACAFLPLYVMLFLCKPACANCEYVTLCLPLVADPQADLDELAIVPVTGEDIAMAHVHAINAELRLPNGNHMDCASLAIAGVSASAKQARKARAAPTS